ncbi:uncharacterized protein LOC121305943 [Polyodon spathula]|uniref:uncharacterized protein LOC121305943 n=1 Tax=Polyodon spathula TaxID=7913 RepID=UPI001B7E8241|nr:uncharacterized protein LOC121305943 [Polyodon spathula]XP_041093574.1 uncharacterized protein LOC121305943 [Polyodon spathula]
MDQPHSEEVSEMETAHISPELPVRWVVSADRTVEIKEEVTELGCDHANERILQEETPPSSITERGTEMKLVHCGRRQESEMASSHIKEETPELEPVPIKEETPELEPLHIKEEISALEPVHVKEKSPVLKSADCEHLSVMSDGNTCAPTTQLRWTEEETRALINIVSDLGVMNRLDRPKQRNQHVYKQVVEALSKRGIDRTVPQARDKFKKLKQSYLQERARRCCSGEAGQSRFRFWEEMNGLLGQRPVAAHLSDTSQHAASEASSSCLDQDPSSSETTASQSSAITSSSPQPQAEELSKQSDSDAAHVERQEKATEAGELVLETPQPDVAARGRHRNARPPRCLLVTEYRRSSLLEMRLMRHQMQAAAARQHFLFLQAERRRQHDWSRWMRQQRRQHQETVAMLSGFLRSIAEAGTSNRPMVDASTNLTSASPGRAQDGGLSIRRAGLPPREMPVPGQEEVPHNCNTYAPT